MTKMQKDPTPAEVLATPMVSIDNGAGADTIGEYLIALLAKLWDEEEEFSGKRPFGDSGWTYDLYVPMIAAGHIEGTLDEDGVTVDDLPNRQQLIGDSLIATAIRSLLPGKTDPPIAQAEVLGVEQEWKIRLTSVDTAGYGIEQTVTAAAPYLSEDGHLEMHSTSGQVVAVFAQGEWASVRRTVTVDPA